MQPGRWIHPLLLIILLGSSFTFARFSHEPVGGADDVTEEIRSRLYLEDRSGNSLDDDFLHTATDSSMFSVLANADTYNPESESEISDSDAADSETVESVGEGADVDPSHDAESSADVNSSADTGPDADPIVEAEPSGDAEPIKPEVFTHIVKRNETLSDIAREYGLNIDTIIAANAISDPNRIRVGDELRILSHDGVLHRIEPGESLWDISRRYNVSIEQVAAVNHIQEPSRISAGAELFLPGAEAARAQQYKEAVVDASGRLIRNFSWPVQGPISSTFGPRWGRMHQGLDIAVVTGTSVRAAANGRVSFSGDNGGYGLLVIIDHGNGVETRYAHNSQLLVKEGDRVQRGQVIARSGNTGNSTGPHVHFEIRQYGQAVNPQSYLR